MSKKVVANDIAAIAEGMGVKAEGGALAPSSFHTLVSKNEAEAKEKTIGYVEACKLLDIDEREYQEFNFKEKLRLVRAINRFGKWVADWNQINTANRITNPEHYFNTHIYFKVFGTHTVTNLSPTDKTINGVETSTVHESYTEKNELGEHELKFRYTPIPPFQVDGVGVQAFLSNEDILKRAGADGQSMVCLSHITLTPVLEEFFSDTVR